MSFSMRHIWSPTTVPGCAPSNTEATAAMVKEGEKRGERVRGGDADWTDDRTDKRSQAVSSGGGRRTVRGSGEGHSSPPCDDTQGNVAPSLSPPCLTCDGGCVCGKRPEKISTSTQRFPGRHA